MSIAQKKDLALVQSEVMDMISEWSSTSRVQIDPDKMDYGLYGDHKLIRPYDTVMEGVNWYMNQSGIEHIPEELILPIIAHNFGISVGEAYEQLSKFTRNEHCLVDLS